jgi:hypothetical protein
MLLIEFYKPARDAFRNIARTRFRLYPVIWLTVLFIWFTAVLCRSVFPPMTSPEGALQFPTLYDSLFTLICKEAVVEAHSINNGSVRRRRRSDRDETNEIEMRQR